MVGLDSILELMNLLDIVGIDWVDEGANGDDSIACPHLVPAQGTGDTDYLGGRYWARTSDLPVVSRLLFR